MPNWRRSGKRRPGKAGKTGKLLADLAALLIGPEFWEDFWKLAGVEQPPLASLPAPGKRVWAGRGNGFGWKGRYRGRVKRLVPKLMNQLEEYLAAHRGLVDLVAEVNQDIVKFNQNHDFLMLRSVLCEMDPELVSKKHWMGSSLEGEACLDLGDAMLFRPQAQAEPMLWPLDEIPPEKKMNEAASHTLSRILKQAPQEVRARMAAKLQDG